ncbi:MAG: translation elongation factor Ts [Lactobacillales bacterium]|jgi:elongation factor Ts|nr:translation elongation factor Ts [Lactobacillales bacterium]
MAEVTAKMVKELRDLTGAGILDAKKALVEVEGDIQKAIALLREKGMAKAAKKADAVAAEGLTATYVTGNVAAVIEVNSQTDFVAKNDLFKTLIANIVKIVAENKPADRDAALALPYTDGGTIADAVQNATVVIGEKIDFRRFTIIEKTDAQTFGAYAHNGGRIGVVDVLEGGDETLAKSVAMHIAAMSPQVLSYTDLEPSFIEDEVIALRGRLEVENEERKRLNNPEKPILPVPTYGSTLQLTAEVLAEVETELKKELAAEGKPEKIWDKIIPGKLNRFKLDNTQIDQQYTLLGQVYALDDTVTVEQHLEKVGAKVVNFVRLEVGDGIEKVETDFAAEVAAQQAAAAK